jgi:hypothetical protein
MKTCVVWGDMSADRASDQYPSVAVCDDCAKTESVGSDDRDAAIISVEAFDPAYGDDECHFCGKTKEEESKENEG